MEKIMICVRSRKQEVQQRMGLNTVTFTQWTCKAINEANPSCPHCSPHPENNACKLKVTGPFLCDGVCISYDDYMAQRSHPNKNSKNKNKEK